MQNLTFADGNSTGETDRGRRRRRDLRPRRPVQGDQLALRRATAATRPAPIWAARRSGCSASTTASRCTSSAAPSAAAGVCSNGGALCSIGVSWVVLNSVMTGNSAIGQRRQPGPGRHPGRRQRRRDLPRRQHVHAAARRHVDRPTTTANEGGGAVFFVSNDRTGTPRSPGSTLTGNPSAGFETAGLPGCFFLGARPPSITGSTLAGYFSSSNVSEIELMQ